MAMLLTTTLPTAIALTVLGLLALKSAWRARRSRRVGDHPHCAACDRDVFGLPEKTDRCPECGADLRARRAVAIGLPRANRIVQVIGAAVALVLLGSATRYWRAVEWTPLRVAFSPTWVLLHSVARDDGIYSVEAGAELERRMIAGSYNEHELEMVMRGLRPLRVFVRSRVRVGEHLPVAKWFGPTNGIGRPTSDCSARPPLHVFTRLDRYQIGERPWVTSEDPWKHEEVRARGQYCISLPMPIDAPQAATTVRLVYVFRLVRESDMPTAVDMRGSPYRREPKPQDAPLVAWEEEIEAPVTFVAADGADVELVAGDAGLCQMLATSLRPRGTQRRDYTSVNGVVIHPNYDGRYLEADWSLEAKCPSIGLAFDGFLRDERGHETAVGSVVFSKDQWVVNCMTSPESSSKALQDFTSTKADLVLRPSISAARATPDLVKIWGEEIVFKNLPVVRDLP